jgi:hypothetical protein
MTSPTNAILSALEWADFLNYCERTSSTPAENDYVAWRSAFASWQVARGADDPTHQLLLEPLGGLSALVRPSCTCGAWRMSGYVREQIALSFFGSHCGGAV